MEKIKVGEFVRTKYGEIGIVTKVEPRLMWRKRKNPSLLEFNEITKHSPNIIDLIEKGDYINGLLIWKDFKIEENQITKQKYIDFDTLNHDVTYEFEIKSIVTKEQFKSMEYGVINNER